MILCSLDIRETKGAPNTFFRTKRLQALIDPMTAKGAFFSKAIPGMKPDRVVRACITTGLASGAFVPVHKNNAIRPLIDRSL
jgi:hypothetical protein